jgi:hypothetical protein
MKCKMEISLEEILLIYLPPPYFLFLPLSVSPHPQYLSLYSVYGQLISCLLQQRPLTSLPRGFDNVDFKSIEPLKQKLIFILCHCATD